MIGPSSKQGRPVRVLYNAQRAHGQNRGKIKTRKLGKNTQIARNERENVKVLGNDFF